MSKKSKNKDKTPAEFESEDENIGDENVDPDLLAELFKVYNI
jgi:hypothetical protein